jgi:hypothetical protein
MSQGGEQMNPVLLLLVFIAGFLTWLVGSSLYKPIGWFFGTLMNNAKRRMFDDEK